MSHHPEIRRLESAADQDAFVNLDAYAFNVPPDQLDWVRKGNRVGENWGAVVGGRVVAGYLLLDFACNTNGAPVPAGGIAAVASAPEYRGRGHVRALMRSCLEVLRDRGVPLALLYPFDYAFYRRFGWELSARVARYTVPVDHLRAAARDLAAVRRLEDADLPAVAEVYAVAAAPHNLTVRRSPEWFRDRVFSFYGHRPGTVFVAEGDGGVEGYVSFRIDTEGDKGGRLLVRELVALTARARRSLLSILYAHRAQAREARITLPVTDPLATELPNPQGRDVTVELLSQVMARVVDWPAAFSARPLLEPAAGALTAGVRDAFAPWNDGVWRLVAEEARLRAERDGSSPDLEADIRTWSQLYAGFWGDRPVSRAARYGHVAVNRPEALPLADAIFAGLEPWHPDYY